MDQQSMQPQTAGNGFNLSEFLSFKKMITLQIIQIVYLVGAILLTLASLAMMFGGSSSDYGSLMPGGFVTGLIFLVCGNILWRVYCELIIIFFRINKTLGDIEKNTRK